LVSCVCNSNDRMRGLIGDFHYTRVLDTAGLKDKTTNRKILPWGFLVPCACVHVIARNRDKYLKKFSGTASESVLRSHPAWHRFLINEEQVCSGALKGNRAKHLQRAVKEFVNHCDATLKFLERGELPVNESTLSAGLCARADERVLGTRRLTNTGVLLKRMGIDSVVRDSARPADLEAIQKIRNQNWPFPF